MENISKPLDNEMIPEKPVHVRRRKLLPLWIKIFIWIFIVFGVFSPLSIVFALLGLSYEISLYGIETNNPRSLVGIFLTGIFLFKGITAFGLWTEKVWAINFGLIDAVIGIIICLAMMVIQVNLRLELIFIIPYLIKLIKIKPAWEKLSG